METSRTRGADPIDSGDAVSVSILWSSDLVLKLIHCRMIREDNIVWIITLLHFTFNDLLFDLLVFIFYFTYYIYWQSFRILLRTMQNLKKWTKTTYFSTIYIKFNNLVNILFHFKSCFTSVFRIFFYEIELVSRLATETLTHIIIYWVK